MARLFRPQEFRYTRERMFIGHRIISGYKFKDIEFIIGRNGSIILYISKVWWT